MSTVSLRKYLHKHPFHLVNPSPWPIFCSFSALGVVLGAAFYMHRYNGSAFILFSSLLLLVTGMGYWWGDVVREATFEGQHTSYVQVGLKLGMILFIVSEIMFFFAFFWSFFHSSLNPSIFIGAVWPPKGIVTINPWGLPLLNTALLLTSGATITYAHHAILSGKKTDAIVGMSLTLLFGGIFEFFQFSEYLEAPFCLSDSIYGTVFYMLTGFHGLHVLVGLLFLIVCLYRLVRHHFTKQHHVGFEAGAWYWHFVDVVWIFVYTFIYIWGGN